jgi:hypothetical protein
MEAHRRTRYFKAGRYIGVASLRALVGAILNSKTVY